MALSPQFNPFNKSPRKKGSSSSRSSHSSRSLRGLDRAQRIALDKKVHALLGSFEEKRKQDLDEGGSDPLNFSWVFFFDHAAKKGMRQTVFAKGVLTEIARIHTIEEFWTCWASMVPVTALPKYCNLRLFRKGIQPLWEDPMNARGGRWVMPVEDKEGLHALWTDLVRLLLLDQFHVGDELCGVILALRPKGRHSLVLWNRSVEEADKLLCIVDYLLHDSVLFGAGVPVYQPHDSAISYNQKFEDRRAQRLPESPRSAPLPTHQLEQTAPPLGHPNRRRRGGRWKASRWPHGDRPRDPGAPCIVGEAATSRIIALDTTDSNTLTDRNDNDAPGAKRDNTGDPEASDAVASPAEEDVSKDPPVWSTAGPPGGASTESALGLHWPTLGE